MDAVVGVNELLSVGRSNVLSRLGAGGRVVVWEQYVWRETTTRAIRSRRRTRLAAAVTYLACVDLFVCKHGVDAAPYTR